MCWYKNAGVAGYAEAFRPVQSDSQTSEWYSYFENDVLVSLYFLHDCGFLLIPHWIASVGQTLRHLPERIHSELLEFSTGSTIIWHAFAHFPHFIHLSLSTLYLYRETGLKIE